MDIEVEFISYLVFKWYYMLGPLCSIGLHWTIDVMIIHYIQKWGNVAHINNGGTWFWTSQINIISLPIKAYINTY